MIFKYSTLLFIILFLVTDNLRAYANNRPAPPHDTLVLRLGFFKNQISQEWKDAIAPRMTKQRLDSVSALIKRPGQEEEDWVRLIRMRMIKWNSFRDSLENIFIGCHVPDTVVIMTGMSEGNDAFTFGDHTICFDLEALQQQYGSARLAENEERTDRLFAHEYTHLVQKEWARKNKLQLRSYKDSILWECFYEGLGMYRSLSKKWLPQNGVLPDITKDALSELCPVFVSMLTEVQTKNNLSAAEKERIEANLSKGPVAKKWGAFTVAVWLALEAGGDDKKLIYLTEKGPACVIQLAKKYLTGENKTRFEKIF